jgi:hypothetical protein
MDIFPSLTRFSRNIGEIRKRVENNLCYLDESYKRSERSEKRSFLYTVSEVAILIFLFSLGGEKSEVSAGRYTDDRPRQASRRSIQNRCAVTNSTDRSIDSARTKAADIPDVSYPSRADFANSTHKSPHTPAGATRKVVLLQEHTGDELLTLNQYCAPDPQ